MPKRVRHGSLRSAVRPVALCAVLLPGIALLSGCDSAEERALSHYQRGLALIAEGEPLKAGLEFRNALKIDKSRIDALFALGKLEESQGRFDKAARTYLTVAERDPGHVEARVRLAYILLNVGQVDRARRYAEEALAAASSDPDVLVLNAAVALTLGNPSEAVRLSSAALEIRPDSADAQMVLAFERFLASDPAGALEFIEQGEKAGGVGSAGEIGLQLVRLMALDAMNDEDSVEAVLTRLAELHPDMPVFGEGLVAWYLDKGRAADAEAALRRQAGENPENVDAQLALVAFIKDEKGSPAAIAELESIIGRGGDVSRYEIALAELEFASGEQADAIARLKTLASGPDRPERNMARVRLARMLAASGDRGEAERLVSLVIEGDHTNVEALGARGAFRLADGRAAEAIGDLLLAVAEAPESSSLLQLLGEAYEREGSVELAEEQYAKAVRIEEQAPELSLQFAQFLLRYGRVAQAERTLDQSLASWPGNADVLALLAELKLGRQDWAGAMAVADLLHTVEGMAGEADRIRAAALNGLGRPAEAVTVLEAISEPDDRRAALSELVTAYVGAGRTTDAESLLADHVLRKPADVQAHVLLGSVYSVSGRNELAESAFKAAIKADPADPAGYAALAEFHRSANRLEQAEAVVRQGMTRLQDDTSLQLLLASILETEGRYDAAITEYEALLAADPTSTIVANNLASLLSERRQDPESLARAYETAARFQRSEVPEFLDTLGWIYYLRDEPARALPLLKTAAERLPSAPGVQYHLGMALKALGQTDLAIASLDRAIALAPDGNLPFLDEARSAVAQLRAAAAPAAPSSVAPSRGPAMPEETGLPASLEKPTIG